MKKILATLLIVFSILAIITPKTLATQTNKKYFRVTAYYSPLPNQKYYLKGSYEAEVKMNGRGIRGASGKKVFSGMLAGPKNYRFGTKIYLKGLGVGEIADRGGAIVKAGERNFKYDRIDLWVGYGDEGLRRALYWGNRIVEGKILNRNSKVTINYKKIKAPYWTTYKLKINKNITKYFPKKTIKPKTEFEKLLEKELKIFETKLKNLNDTKILQERLSDLGLYSGKIDGNYDNIKDIILNYQLEKKLIKTKNTPGAGYFGPKTRASLKKDYKNYLIAQEEERKKIKAFEEKLDLLEKQALEKATKSIKNLGYLRKGQVSSDVRTMQKILKKVGYFDYKDTAIFGQKTYLSLVKYQLDKNVIKNTYEPGTGIFGPNTKKQLIKDYTQILFWEEIQKDKDLTLYYQKKNSNSMISDNQKNSI